MADLTYKFTGVNTAQLANEVQRLRRNSSTFQALEAAAVAAGYTTIEIKMGAGLLPGDIADSTKTNSFTRTIRINSDATGSWGVGGRQATVGEVIAHELAHAVVPSQYERHATIDPQERDSEGMWVRRQAGQVALDLGLPGANNADYPITRIPVDKEQVCTRANPLAVTPEDGILFLDGSRGYNGKGSTIPPGSGSQDPVDSRRLATDEIGQVFTPAGSDGPFQLRRRDSPLGPLLRDPTVPNSPGDETQGILSDKPERRLSRRIVNPSASASQATEPAMPLSPSNEVRSPDNRVSFGDRFGNWTSPPESIAPFNPNLAVAPPESSRPLPQESQGLFP
jgi:hypothetical protein